MSYKIKIFSLFLIMGLMSNCSAPYKASQVSYPKESETYEGRDTKLEERVMIYEAYLELVVHEPDALKDPFADIAKKYEGYLVRFSPEQAAIRVKSESLNEAMADLEKLGKVRDKGIRGEDVTDTFMDAQIRLENAEKTRQRYLELLQKAVNVEEILKIETELSRLNEQIDLLKGKLNSINRRARLSLIEINIHKKVKLGVLGYVSYGIYKGVAWLFVRK